MAENRWYTKTGRRKRVVKEVMKFKSFATKHAENFKTSSHIPILVDIRQTYNLGLSDAMDLFVFINGCYNNGAFCTPDRFERGKALAENL